MGLQQNDQHRHWDSNYDSANARHGHRQRVPHPSILDERGQIDCMTCAIKPHISEPFQRHKCEEISNRDGDGGGEGGGGWEGFYHG